MRVTELQLFYDSITHQMLKNTEFIYKLLALIKLCVFLCNLLICEEYIKVSCGADDLTLLIASDLTQRSRCRTAGPLSSPSHKEALWMKERSFVFTSTAPEMCRFLHSGKH